MSNEFDQMTESELVLFTRLLSHQAAGNVLPRNLLDLAYIAGTTDVPTVAAVVKKHFRATGETVLRRRDDQHQWN